MTIIHDRSIIQEVTTRARAAVGALSRAERDQEAARFDVNAAIAEAQVATDRMTALVEQLDAAQAEQRELLAAGDSSVASFPTAYARIAAQIALIDARLGAAAHARMLAEMASQAASKALSDATDRVLRGQAAAEAADPAQYGLPVPPADEDDDDEDDLELGSEPI